MSQQVFCLEDGKTSAAGKVNMSTERTVSVDSCAVFTGFKNVAGLLELNSQALDEMFPKSAELISHVHLAKSRREIVKVRKVTGRSSVYHILG